MKHFFTVLIIIGWNLTSFAQPILITQFDKTRCAETRLHYKVKSLPGNYKFPIAFNGNPDLQKWVLWMVKGDSFQRLDQGFARFFVFVQLPAIGQYALVVDII